MKNKNLCIIQARTASTRLPNKVLLKVGKTTLLEYEIKRIKRAKKVHKIVVATTCNKEDDKIEKLCKRIKIPSFRGSENDVLDRYYQCSLLYPQYNNIVRLTGDCPLIDPKVIDDVILFFEKNNLDFATNAPEYKETFPDGIDVEVFKKSALEKAAKEAKLPLEREHIDPYFLKNKKISKGYFNSEKDWSHFRLTVDEKEDFEIIKFLMKNSKIDDDFLHYISLLTKNPKIMLKNKKIKRNEGFRKFLENKKR